MRYVFRAFAGFTLLVATDSPIWTIQTTAEIDPPRVYHADLDGSDVRLTKEPSG